jgi:hypothetical protein
MLFLYLDNIPLIGLSFDIFSSHSSEVNLFDVKWSAEKKKSDLCSRAGVLNLFFTRVSQAGKKLAYPYKAVRKHGTYTFRLGITVLAQQQKYR